MTAPESGAARNGVSAHQSAGTPFPFSPEGTALALEALEFDRVLELVAGFAVGPLGAECIRARQPSVDPDLVRESLAPVGELLALLAQGGAVEVEAVPPLAAVLARLRLEGSVLEGLELLAVRRTLGAARAAAAELQRIADEAPRIARLRVPVPEASLAKRLQEALDDTGDLLDTASPALFRARREVHAARERLIKQLESVLRGVEAGGASSGASVTVRNGRYVIPVRRDSRARLAGIVHDESASAGTLFIEPSAAIELGNALRAAMTEAEREALRVLRDLTDRLRPHADALAAAHAMCVALDDLLARGRYARSVGAAVPGIAPVGGAITLRTARHPLLLARGVAVVAVDLDLGAGERTLLVSGPNTGGKTVLLKTIGLAAALVQSGIVPPVGTGSALPVFTRIAADIGDHQSITADLSTFSAHVATLRRVLEEADAATLVLIDEIGSGTDPAEGGALAAAALVALTRKGALTVATTHLGALKALAAESEGIVNGSFEFDAERLAPTYRFQKGRPGRSYGLAIARRLGIGAEILADAEGRVSAAERSLDALLEAAEARERRLAEDQGVLRDRLADAERETARLARQSQLQDGRDAELRSRERDAERKARTEARRFLLDARAQVEEALRVAQAAGTEAAAREARRALEDAIHAEGAALERVEETVPAGGVPLTLALGQQVRLATGGTGEVLELRDDGKAVVLAGAMRMVVGVETLMPVAKRARERGSQGATGHGRSGSPAVRNPDSPTEIDLRGLRGDEAEAVTLAALDAAILADNPYLRIIHGMGTGVVRETVRRVLAADRRVAKFDFAPRNQGGTGVTVVEFGT